MEDKSNIYILILFAVCFAWISAAPSSGQNDKVIKLRNDVGRDDFSFELELSDGTSQKAQGQLKHVDGEHSAIVQSGSYKFKGDDGLTYKIEWTADELGFHPKSPQIE